MGKLKQSAQRRALAINTGVRHAPNPWIDSKAQTSSNWIDYVQFGDNVPMWASKIEEGRNVSTTMFGDRGVVLSSSEGSYTQFAGTYETRGNGNILHAYNTSPLLLPLAPSDLLEKARTMAETQFTKRFRRHTTQFETGIFAGELMQTVRMLVNPAKDLRNSLTVFHHDLGTLLKNIKRNEFRTGRTATAKAIKDAIAGSWLTWSFGVKPLMSDLDDAARAFRALASGRTFENVRFTGEGNAESTTISRETYVCSGFAPLPELQAEIRYKFSVGVKLGGAWQSNVTGSAMPVPYIFGTRFLDIVPTAWELVPWSWFADYFTNIGEVLSVWAMRQIDFAWLNETIRYRTEKTVLAPPGAIITTGSTTWVNNVNSHGPLQLVRYKVQRNPYDNSWTATPLVKIPGVSGTDANRWLNIAAVLAMKKSPIQT